MRVLFVCNQGKNRSRTAAQLFSAAFETAFAGLYSERPLRAEQIAWADIVVVMEKEQAEEIERRFPRLIFEKRLICLDVPDIYAYQQPELVALLESRVGALVEPLLE